MTDVKICGTRTVEGARQAVEGGASYLGFIFAPVRRYVAPDRVAEILGAMPGRSSIRAVGVFVDEPLDRVLDVVRVCDLDVVQLHGAEPPSYAESLSRHVPVVKAFRIAGPADFAAMARYDVFGYHVEPRVAGHLGGAGIALDWDAVRRSHDGTRRLFLSGGLRPDTVAKAIEKVRPTVVDVSSGIETDGAHDVAKIAAFLHAVREADAVMARGVHA